MIARRLRKIASPAAEEVAYLCSLTDLPFKETFPARAAEAPASRRTVQVHYGRILGEFVRAAIRGRT
jgi:hypothetical protein